VTGSDVDFIVTLEEVSPDGKAMALTQGWLRGSHRALDPALSRRGAPWHRHDRAEAIPAGEPVRYAIALVPTARRVLPGHRLRVRLCSSDHGGVAMLGFEHTPLGLASRQTVLSSSRLVLPLLDGALP
jgi:predicted acyl esterase